MAGSARLCAALVVPVMSTITACSLLLESGLSGGADQVSDGVRFDADVNDAPPGSDGAPIDAGADDAPDAPDAPDASDASDASPWCVNGPNRFCDDFDDAAPGALWTSTGRYRGAIAFDGVGLSPPNALRATTSQAGGRAYVSKALASHSATLRCELDVKIVQLSQTGEVDILDIGASGGDVPSYKLYLASFDETWCLAEYFETPDGEISDLCNELFASPPIGSWFHVSMVVTPTAATVSLNGASTRLDGIQPPPGSARDLRLGLTWTSEDASPSEILFDNVDCTF